MYRRINYQGILKLRTKEQLEEEDAAKFMNDTDEHIRDLKEIKRK